MPDNLIFSERTNWELSLNELVVAYQQLKESNVPVLDLTASNPTECGFSYPPQTLDCLSTKENLNYDPSPRGLLRAREAIVQYYASKGISLLSQQIFLTSSTSEAYSYLFRLLANPGERIFFPQPSYPLFQFLADMNDIEMGHYPLIYSAGAWKIDFNQLNEKITFDTKALVLVNPNNPTGSFVKRHELTLLNDLCARKNIPLISDEVFGDFSFEENKDYASLINNNEVLTFVLGGLSKTLGLPQMKLSWIVMSGPQGLVEKAQERLEVIADTFLSVNTPAQNALNQWLPLREGIQKEIKARLKQNLEFIQKQAAFTSSCQLLKSEGGWYVILKIPKTRTEEEWALKFLNKYHVFVYPGYFFDFHEEAYIVISLLPPHNVFQEGVERILSRIEQEVS